MTDSEIKQWNDYKTLTLVPLIRASPFHISTTKPVTFHIPTMEKLFADAIAAYKSKKYRSSWVSFMRCATYIMKDLRHHPKWNQVSSKDKDRLMTVLATKSIAYAEQAERHCREQCIQQFRSNAAQKQREQQQDAATWGTNAAAAPIPEHSFRTTLTMYVNGESVVVPPTVDPHMRLVDFLRNHLGKTGTKIGCGEGGCGACSVLMSYNSVGAGTTATTPTHKVINSCLRSIASCDGASITTVEGIGAKGPKQTMHPVQERLAQCNGSQCGFCSPGWVMNAYAMLMNDPNPTSVQAVQDRFDGNLCRCTGMRSILKAFSSFVPSADQNNKTLAPYDAQAQLEEANRLLPTPISRENMALPLKLVGNKRRVEALEQAQEQEQEQKKEFPHASTLVAPTIPTWYAPTTLVECNSILTGILATKTTYSLELGGTSRGVAKYYDGQVDATSSGTVEPEVYVSLFRVKELHAITVDAQNNINMGSAVTLSELIQTLQNNTTDQMHQQLARHLSRVASLQVRNVAGWAGNLSLAKMYSVFPSDLLTTLSTVGATLTIQRWSTPTAGTATSNQASKTQGTPTLPQPTVEHLSVPAWTYETPSNETKDVLLSVSIPPSTTTTAPTSSTSSTATTPRTCFTSYKLARRQQNSPPLVNFACRLLFDTDDKTILSATIYLHGDDNSPLTHAVATCNALIGKDISLQTTLDTSLAALATIDVVNRAPFVVSAASSLLFKALLASQPNGNIAPSLVSATHWQLPRGASTGTEVWSLPDPSKETPPAGTGCTKVTAPLQCTGQAKYASDFMTHQLISNGTLLHAVPIQSTRALAIVSAIDTTVATTLPGVVAVITAKDIDTSIGMVNDCGVEGIDNGGNASPEQIFVPVNGTVQTTGQTIALVVGTTREAAKKAAIAMMDPMLKGVTYTNTKEQPILTLDDAIAKGSFYEGSYTALLERLAPNVTSIDSALSACAHTWKGTVRMSGQRHFYMETQRAIVRPTENNGIHIRSSTQGPTVVAKYVAKACGLLTHNVVCEQVRAGGGFGGKLTRNLPISTACAVASKTLQQPVEYKLDRVEDQKTTGGREPMRMDIEVGFDATGQVNAFKVCLFMDAGWTIEGTFGDLDMGTFWSDNAYHVPNFHCESKACRTNTPTSTSMRAPGVLHATCAIETAMDHVAAYLNMDPNTVRLNNFVKVGDVTPYGQTLKYVSLNKCWSQTLAIYTTLRNDCNAFNVNNRWVKRAVAMTPAKYGIGWSSTFSGSNVSIYGRDGSIVISHGGCEIGQGLFTKAMQAAASALGLTDPKDFDLIRTGPTSNVMVPNNVMTGGSSTSEVTCQSVMNACATLAARLKPYRDPVASGGKGLPWREAVAAAWGDRVQLSAQGWFAPEAVKGDHFRYFVYGSALSMVELDVLTGQVQILRSDIVYDCGNSINPVIDIGQIEGGFVMGIGTWLTEEVTFDSTSGKLTSNGSWKYKPPCSKDIPLEFNVRLLKDNPNVVGVLSSKATGEPPMILTNSVYFALRRCIELARLDRGLTNVDARTFALNAPATAEHVVSVIGTVPTKEFVYDV